jgi:diketogulonate reductase-like aldo/keto reductase
MLEVGFGTYPLTGAVCTKAVQCALSSGYQIIDTATFYGNFEAIAHALKHVERSCYQLISKVWHDKQSPHELIEDLEKTLTHLHTDYLDFYLLHWPNSKMPIEETLHAMNALRIAGKIRHIGLSNVSVNHVKRALEVGVPISCVQVEMHPYFCDFELLAFCKQRSITIQAWAPLGRGRISHDRFLADIGVQYGKSASQVAIRWIVQHGCIPLPGSQNEKHIRENCAIFDFALPAEEMAVIDRNARVGKRERITKEMIGFDDEFDFSYAQCWSSHR